MTWISGLAINSIALIFPPFSNKFFFLNFILQYYID
jgi:hypothetical protein